MAVFEYKALTKSGKNKTGIIDADSKDSAKLKLKEKALYPVSIKEVEISGIKNKPSLLSVLSIKKIKQKDITIVSRQIATLLSARFHLVGALDAVVKQIKSSHFKTILSKIKDDVEAGKTFAEALSVYPDVFSSVYVNMIQAAEASGTLEVVMEKIADLMETSEKRKAKIRSALAYPLMMAFFGAIVLVILMTMVVPKIVSIFSDMNQQLPFVTILLIAISDFLKRFWWVLAIIIALIPAFVKYLFSNDKTGYFMDSFILKIPVIGSLTKKNIISRFSRILAALLKYDVPILKSMDIVINIAGNRIIKTALKNAKKGVEKGEGLSYSLEKENLFPEITLQMISIGEKTGNLEEMLAKIADIYENETENLIVTLTSLLEPLIIIFMAVIVGFIVFSICIPIFQMNQLVG